jgi:hypothetical protein
VSIRARLWSSARTTFSDLSEPPVNDHDGVASAAELHPVNDLPAASTRVGGPPRPENSTVSVDPVSSKVGTQRRRARRLTCQHIVASPVVSVSTPDEPGCERELSDEDGAVAGLAGDGTRPAGRLGSAATIPDSENAAVGWAGIGAPNSSVPLVLDRPTLHDWL